ncbi:MAG: molybdopterin-dependent oxidoreductase [Yoonia sp.]|uniref:molybdopterin-dependent oxidoreductase n=1 Tax=Yoonia sp. TaxID=2212373 RepID=UPI00273F8C64|nr:molybdopterin-dependent oxidoreductase [Yoonia sp.]MDP5085535.1 molybdopterin-dependent oxidoreductase [Yoonia sp.]
MLAQIVKTTFGLVAVIGIAAAASAQDIALPQGAVVLTVTGEIDVANADGTLIFDRETLAALGTEEFETTTIWTEGLHRFEGVSLKTLTDLIGAQEGTLLATAINDYTVEIPVSDAVADGPIIAFKMDGETMSVRDKGPLWVVYPYDMSADYRSEVIYSRSIWQLDRIEVVK